MSAEWGFSFCNAGKVSSVVYAFYNKRKCAYLKKSDQFQCYKYVQLKRNHLDFSKSIIFVEKCNLRKIVPGIQNLLYSAISEILLGKRPGLEGEQNLAVWRTGIANGKLFLMLVTIIFMQESFEEEYCDISPRLKYFCGHLYLWFRLSSILYFYSVL